MLRITLVGIVILIAFSAAVTLKLKRASIEPEPAIAAEPIAPIDSLQMHLRMQPHGVPTEDAPQP